jgi:host factor-I protein
MKPNYPPVPRFERDPVRENKDMKLQDVFLNYCRREKILVSIQLLDKSNKQGQIVGFDLTSIILEDEGRQYLVYKSAMVAVNPKQAVNYIFNDAHRQEWSRCYSEYTTDLA